MLTLQKNVDSEDKFNAEELMSRKYDYTGFSLCFTNKFMAVAVIGG